MAIDPRTYYEKAGIARHGFLRTEERHLYSRFATHGERHPAFTLRLKQMGELMASRHKEAQAAKREDEFKAHVVAGVKKAERNLRKGSSPEKALEHLIAHFKVSTPLKAEREKMPGKTTTSTKAQASRGTKPRRFFTFGRAALLASALAVPLVSIGIAKVVINRQHNAWLAAKEAKRAKAEKAGNPLPEETKDLSYGKPRETTDQLLKRAAEFEQQEAKKKAEQAERNAAALAKFPAERYIPVPLFELLREPGKDWDSKVGAYAKRLNGTAEVNGLGVSPEPEEYRKTSIEDQEEVGAGGSYKPKDLAPTQEALDREAQRHLARAQRLLSTDMFTAARSYAMAINMGHKLEGEDLANARRLVAVIGPEHDGSGLVYALKYWQPRIDLLKNAPQQVQQEESRDAGETAP